MRRRQLKLTLASEIKTIATTYNFVVHLLLNMDYVFKLKRQAH